jgi:hypothetical protein
MRVFLVPAHAADNARFAKCPDCGQKSRVIHRFYGGLPPASGVVVR